MGPEYPFYSLAALSLDVDVVRGPGVDSPEAATDGDDDERHQDDHQRPEVHVRLREVRLLGVRSGLGRVNVAGLQILPMMSVITNIVDIL